MIGSLRETGSHGMKGLCGFMDSLDDVGSEGLCGVWDDGSQRLMESESAAERQSQW